MWKRYTILVIVVIIVAILASACSVPAADQSAGGASGATGATGATGITGPTGATGPAGQAGAPGSAGTQGPNGAKGAKGAAGQPGAIGPAGAAGAIGPMGPMGATGANGINGATGATGVAGPAGVAGLAGATGPAGAQGPIGATGAQGVTGPPVTMVGAYSSGTIYAVGDAVTYIGSSYISLVNSNIGHTPGTGSIYWAVLAQQGATGIAGPPGATGATGATGPLANMEGEWSSSTAYNIGDCVTYNGSAYFSISGSYNVTPPSDNTVWLLMAAAGATGPTGVTGSTGATGPTGAMGPGFAEEGFSAYIPNIPNSSGTQLAGWTAMPPYYNSGSLNQLTGDYMVQANGKYSIKATINYAAAGPVALGPGQNLGFVVRRTSPVTTDLVAGYVPIMDVNAGTILGSGTVTLSNDVQLNKDDIIGLFYEDNGLGTTLNLGNGQGVYFSVHRIA